MTMISSPRLGALIQSLQVLPGVGPKSAQRMALALLHKDRSAGQQLAVDLAAAMTEIKECELCRNYSEHPICGICANQERDQALLCVVESPADILAIEQAGGFRGLYFVLHGRLSPIDGVGPEQLGMTRLQARVSELNCSEVIVATNPTVEGEATAHYIRELLGGQVKVSRIAHGMPIGGELEYIDGGTIVHALQGRRQLSR